MKIHVINTGNFKLDGGAMFGVVPKTLWSKTNPADQNNMCSWAMRYLLIETENKKILCYRTEPLSHITYDLYKRTESEHVL